MDKSIICAIFDKVANMYSGLLLFTNEDCAKRYFKTKIQNDPTNASDYELYYLGDYNAVVGLICALDHPILIAKGIIEDVKNI